MIEGCLHPLHYCDIPSQWWLQGPLFQPTEHFLDRGPPPVTPSAQLSAHARHPAPHLNHTLHLAPVELTVIVDSLLFPETSPVVSLMRLTCQRTQRVADQSLRGHLQTLNLGIRSDSMGTANDGNHTGHMGSQCIHMAH